MIIAATALFLAALGPDLAGVRRLYAENRLAEAESALVKMLQSNPRNADAKLRLAYTRLAGGDLESALQDLERVGDTFQSDPEYLYAHSEAATRRSRELSERLSGLGEHSARTHQLLAYRYNQRGEWQIAVKELRRAAELRPGVAGVHLDAAEILWAQKQYDEAVQELRAELAINPSDFLASLRYGQS